MTSKKSQFENLIINPFWTNRGTYLKPHCDYYTAELDQKAHSDQIRHCSPKVESSGARVRQGPARVEDAVFMGETRFPRSEQSSLEGAVLPTRMGNHIFDVLMF